MEDAFLFFIPYLPPGPTAPILKSRPGTTSFQTGFFIIGLICIAVCHSAFYSAAVTAPVTASTA